MSNDSSFFKDSGSTSQISTNLAQRATDAETAKTAAEAAKVAAEAAQTSAEAASLNASSASASASSSSLTAQTHAQTATTKASEASASASAAAASEVNSASSETNSASSETNAATSATSASTAATSAQSAQTAAETAKTAAETAQTAAEAAKTSAETAETNATSASTSSSNSAATAATQAATATTKAGEAATSATNAATSEANAATSETNAATSETNAASSEANASSSASSATTQAGIANTQAGIATTKAGEASTSATSAQTAQTASESARDLALSYRNTAETHKDAAAVSSATATTQAGVSSAQATISTTKAGEASSSASSAASAQTAAEAARDSALTALDNFDDRYLGSKTSDPTVDNDGNALVGGSLFFDSTNGIMKVYTGSAWVAAYASTAGTLLVANNLSDVQSAATSRTNLGLSTVAATGAYSDLTGKPSLFDGAFSSLTGTPTTIAGYGITDALQLGTTATTALAGNTSIPSALTDLGISDGTANQVLSTDGSGSFTFVDQSGGGGDADTLDGIDSTQFLRSDANDSVTGVITFPLTGFKISDQVTVSHSTDQTYKTLTIKNEGDDNEASIDGLSSDGTRQFMLYGGAQNQGFLHPVNYTWRLKIPLTGSLNRDNAYTIWDSGNDGSGSGLDADTLDGIQGSSFLRSDTDDSTSGKLNVGTNTTLNSTGQLNIYSSSHPFIGWYSGSTNRGAYLQYISSSDYFLHGHVSYSQSEGSYRAPIFYDSNNTSYYTNPAGTSYMQYLGRLAHNTGHLVGSYNSVGANSSQSNPIYTIGSAYNPSTTTLSNMYGIGFSHTNASFIGFAGSSGWGMYVASDGDARIYLSGQQGQGYFTGNITAYASDERLKTNIKPVQNALDKVCQLRGVEFDWVDNITSEYDFHPQTMHETGVLAQNVAEHIPDAVTEAPMNANYTAKNGTDHQFLTVDKEKIIPVLIEAIKELKAEIDMLKGEVNV